MLGVSDKTVSKWETGRGMPDVSAIPDLCEKLKITSNELLAGERLSDAESFNRKAEENIMSLMKENERKKAGLRWSFIGGLIGMAILAAFMGITSGGIYSFYWILDPPSFCAVVGLTLLVLVASGQIRDFFVGIGNCFRRQSDAEQRDRYLNAIKTAMLTNFFGGFFFSALSFVITLANLSSPEIIGPNLSVALLTTFYGAFFNIFLLPVKARLETTQEKAITFEDLEKVDLITLSGLLKDIEIEKVVKACAGTSPSNKEHIKQAVGSERFEELAKEISPIEIKAVENAQEEILSSILKH